jgi:putative transposase
LIDFDHRHLSLRRQCELIGLSRASLYYQPAGETELNLKLMRLIDEQYTRTPFYGSPKMTVFLQRLGHQVNHKRVERLMHKMGLQALCPQPSTSQPASDQKVYPYLLRGLEITRPLQVWAADITYVRMMEGFMYLVAILDWFSRYVVAWDLSNSLETSFCLVTLQQALEKGKPDIFNSDQGAQFTALAFTSVLLQEGIQISMDGRGRVFDNIFVERLWRTVKYEDIYLKNYETVPALRTGLTDYFTFYNNERPHQSLEYQTPAEIHFQ